MWFVPAILALPLIEIALFVVIGSKIGLWATLAWVVLSALIGMALIRGEGMRATLGLRNGALQNGGLRDGLRDPTVLLANGAMTILSGMLLILPGFFTDAIGLILLLPPVRALVHRWLAKRVDTRSFGFGAPRGPGQSSHQQTSGFDTASEYNNRAADPGVIDGEFHEIGGDSLPPRGSSGWTQK